MALVGPELLQPTFAPLPSEPSLDAVLGLEHGSVRVLDPADLLGGQRGAVRAGLGLLHRSTGEADPFLGGELVRGDAGVEGADLLVQVAPVVGQGQRLHHRSTLPRGVDHRVERIGDPVAGPGVAEGDRA